MVTVIKKTYSLFIGRYQPPHAGHVALIRTALDRGKNVCIALRDTTIGKDNPMHALERKDLFENMFEKEIKEGKIMIIVIPDIDEVCVGRKVGYDIREIKLDEITEKISGTQIRTKVKENKE